MSEGSADATCHQGAVAEEENGDKVFCEQPQVRYHQIDCIRVQQNQGAAEPG